MPLSSFHFYLISSAGNTLVFSEEITMAKEILYDGWYYDVSEFISRHPGGATILEYHTKPGEDSTLAIQQFHHRSMSKVKGVMGSLRRRPASNGNGDELEELDDPETKRIKELTKDFLELFLQFQKEGLFEPSYLHIFVRVLEAILLTLLGALVLTSTSSWAGGWWWGGKLLGCVLLALGQGRAGWLQHEGGHNSLTGRPKVDRFLQSALMGTSQGIAGSWWKHYHNKHHAMTNRLHHDLDLTQTLPLVAYNLGVIEDPKESGWLLRHQKYFIVVDALLGFSWWKFWNTPTTLLKRVDVPDMLFIGLHYALAFRYMSFWTYVWVAWLTALYLFAQFGLSHTFLPVREGACHWVEAALLHTTDVEQRPWCDWWMGYLNYQIEHHLFPTMPQYKNPRVVGRVKELAAKHGLPYHVHSYREAAWLTFNNVAQIEAELNEMKKKLK